MTSISKTELFHPLEISICGHSGSGKTTLVTKLIELFSNKFKVGYIKHDAHQFEMDRAGKDTAKAASSGADIVAISSPEKSALILNHPEDRFFMRQNVIDSDVVFIEGYKDSLGSKILVWTGTEDDQKLLEKYSSNNNDSLLAIVGQEKHGPVQSIPYFNRDDISNIYSFIDEYWKSLISTRKIYGLVLGGGRSRRMGQDKGSLNYHGKSQLSYVYELLSEVTQETFVSCRSDQVQLEHTKGLSVIEDRFLDFGPTGGILSAFNHYPNATWLVVACDMPYVNSDVIAELLEGRNPYRLATCFYNDEKKWPEPLCALYEPKAAIKLGYYLAMNKPCPRKVLMNSRIEHLKLLTQNALDNVNTSEESRKVIQQLSGEKHENKS